MREIYDPAERHVTRRCRARQPVVDRLAKSVLWDRLRRDGGRAAAVELLEHREKVGRRLAEIADGRKVEHC